MFLLSTRINSDHGYMKTDLTWCHVRSAGIQGYRSNYLHIYSHHFLITLRVLTVPSANV